MKLLIAYDGSECSDAAIVDLRRAGLPTVAEALILSVQEACSPVAAGHYSGEASESGACLSEVLEREAADAGQSREACAFAALAADRLRGDFPGWRISTEAWVDQAASAIIRESHAWRPDLIVVGSHGRTGLSRLVLGSVSEHVTHQVDCSVRIGRHHLHCQQRAIRLLIGVDGSENARAAVKAVAARNWPAGAEARVVGVLDSRIQIAAATTLEGTIPVAIEDEARRRMSGAVHEAAQELKKSGLLVTHQVLAGRPSDVLIAEADKWGADCIFLGARRLSGLERILLGSVSSCVAAHAPCSVEIVRSNSR
ncbi:MAG: universal stress protein [Tepidisphaeraceae bacterium]|jgi:nucleotide-binding universal stress UspA family protein